MKPNNSALDLIIGSTQLKMVFGFILLSWILGGIGIGMVFQGSVLVILSLAVLFGNGSRIGEMLGMDESLLRLFSSRSKLSGKIAMVLTCLVNILFVAGGIAILQGAGLCNQNLLCILWKII
jgi:hypothetical protein